MTPQRSYSDGDLHAYLDAETPAEDRAAVEAWLNEDAAAAERLKRLRALDQRLKGAFADVLEQPVPPALTRTLERGYGWRRMRRLATVAAALVLAAAGFAAGYATRGQIEPRRVVQFVETAIGAHTVFAPEVRHPVEVVAAEEEHLVAWLTKRVGHKVRAPNLARAGFKLVGGRLLSDRSVPAAQLMYEDAKGRRLTLYIRREDRIGNTSFRFASHDDVHAFYWIDRPVAYALIGKLTREELMAAARLTYEQLER